MSFMGLKMKTTTVIASKLDKPTENLIMDAKSETKSFGVAETPAIFADGLISTFRL
jgi:hypothetical protein